MGQRTTTLALHQAQPLTHPHISSHCLSFSLYPTHTHTRIQTGSAPSEIGTRIWTGSEEPERASERASEREREREREKERCFIDKTERKIEKRERSSLSSTPVWEREREREREKEVYWERDSTKVYWERDLEVERAFCCAVYPAACVVREGGRERERERERVYHELNSITASHSFDAKGVGGRRKGCALPVNRMLRVVSTQILSAYRALV